MNRHEVKDNPADPGDEDYRIVEAYGDRKYPKLVEQVASDVPEIRIRALAVLCDELKSPYGIFGCCVAGVIQVIAAMCTDPDDVTRELASAAVALVAQDAYGVTSILEDDVVPAILAASTDASIFVREHVFECMYQLSRTSAGVVACVQAGVSHTVAKVLSTEDVTLQPILLKCIYNLSSFEAGLEDALDQQVVKLCIELLSSDVETIRGEAARTLGYLCFSDRGKNQAVEAGAVPALMTMLHTIEGNMILLAAMSLALMAVTSTDEGKRQLNLINNSIEMILRLLHSKEKVITLNALKIIANVSVHPSLRNQLKKHEDCLTTLHHLVDGHDSFTKKHAQIALDAVLWKP